MLGLGLVAAGLSGSARGDAVLAADDGHAAQATAATAAGDGETDNGHAALAGSRELKVLSFNMRQWTRDTDSSLPTYWKTRMAAMEKMIEDVDPDVICFQEFLAPVGRYVPDGYRRVGVTVSHPIFVRKGLKTSGHSVSIHWDACFVEGVQIINVHTRWESDILAKTVLQVNGRLSGRDIACGDWNNGLKTIENAGLNMSSARVALGIPETDTFANFSRPEKSHGAIDHFFLNGFSPVSYRMITDGYGSQKMSDHFPVLLVCRW